MEGYPPPYHQPDPYYGNPPYPYDRPPPRSDYMPYIPDHRGPPQMRGGAHRHERPMKPREIQPKPMYKQPPKVGNTIFIKNLPFRLTKDNLLKKMSEYGEIAYIKERISERGFAFITYYDTRSAQKAVDSTSDINFYGRNPKIDFSYPSPSYSGLDPVTTCPRVVLTVTDATLGNQLEMSDILKEAENFGEVRSNSFEQGKHVVEFFNYKVAHSFAEKFNPGEIKNINVKAQITPEEEEAVLITPTKINGQFLPAPPPIPYPQMDHYMPPQQPQYMPPQPMPPQPMPPQPQYYQTSAPIQYGIPEPPPYYNPHMPKF